ncbi:MAG: protein kinase [Acidobacteriota bacterium]
MIGKSISHFKITAKLGEGGMGEVYRGEDTELDRQVAIKVLPPDLAEDPERLERFRREAKAVAALNHPNIVTIHAIEEAEGTRILIMELIEGTSLDEMLSSEGLPLAQVFDIAVPIADALAAAHDRGIVHRDLKPANVMVTRDGRVKVLDFGLAKLAADGTGPPSEGDEGEPTLAAATATLTREGAVMGTAPYMSPEQLQGLAVDHRSDIFSLGIVLYEMISGRRPFKGATGIALASSILKDTPPAVTELREQLPRHLGRIVGRCLEKDPERRYQSVKDVRNELEDLREEALSGAQPQATSVSSGGFPKPVGEGTPTSDRSPQAVMQPAPAPPSDVPPSTPPQPPAPASVVAATSPAPGTDVPSSGAIATPRVRAPRRGLFVGAIAALLILVAAGSWWMGQRGSRPSGEEGLEMTTSAGSGSSTGATEAGQSVAVLPFDDLSPDKDQEYFTDGMTEEILQALGTIEDLKVPSRTAVFALKGKGLDIQQVGERLGVANVLEGSVRKAGNRLRISTQLVQVEDGFKLWSETYDRELDDVFAIQDEIAGSIANASGGEQEGDLEAADQASLKALELAPELGPAHLARGRYFEQSGREDDAEREYQEALRLDPKNFEAYSAYGSLKYRQGELDRAAELWERAVELDPDGAQSIDVLPQVYRSLGEREEELRALQRLVEWSQRRLELFPDDNNARVKGAIALMQLGQRDRAEEWLRLVEESSRGDSLTLYNIACVYSVAGEVDRGIDFLERSVEAGAHDLSWFLQDSDLDNLRGDPRFEALIEGLKTAQGQD